MDAHGGGEIDILRMCLSSATLLYFIRLQIQSSLTNVNRLEISGCETGMDSFLIQLTR